MSVNNTQPHHSQEFTSGSSRPDQQGHQSPEPDVDSVGQSYIRTVVKSVQDKIAPVWPLQDYVAVNPYLGFSDQNILDARQNLRKLSQLELMMPLNYYRQAFARGVVSIEDIDAAIDELVADGVEGAEQLGRNEIVSRLQSGSSDSPGQAADSTARILKTYAEMVDQITGSDWNRTILDEISKHCSAHYDQGQSLWSSPWQDLTLYEAWRATVQYDLNYEMLGVSGFRQLVSQLPQDPWFALVELLKQLNVPHTMWAEFLLCESFAMPGWSAWMNYCQQQAQREGSENVEYPALLVMRLAYEVSLAQEIDLHVNWASYETRLRQDQSQTAAADLTRYALLRATEIALRNQMLGNMVNRKDDRTTRRDSETRQLAQMVFCIDVRSERIRRNLEASSSRIETFGFAGFFGMPIEMVPLGEEEGTAQVPALASPRFKVYEKVGEYDSSQENEFVEKRSLIRSIRKSWKEFQTSAVSSFSFVEATGFLYAFSLIRRAFGIGTATECRYDGLSSKDRHLVAPSLDRLAEQDVDLEQLTELAESVLRGIGITDNFARLIVLCGHGSKSENNPLNAGLECGACGGHSGRDNARFAAQLLNQQEIRDSLGERGIDIPDDTLFVPALHNTTTDEIDFPDTRHIPESHSHDLIELQESSRTASLRTRCERLSQLPGPSPDDLFRRSRDWSEVRPEWGLAGNAAFIAAPRSQTSVQSLEGRAFLHSYDFRQDPDFKVLEQIMTAPMVVAHWINMQYYASTVDPDYFGSGNKTIHNVTGQFGILSGNGGDLMTGLPMQSVHDGKEFRHEPVRLLCVLVAPRVAIEAIIARHQLLKDLVTNGWLQLVAVDDDMHYRFTEQQVWDQIAYNKSQTPSSVISPVS